MKTVLITGAKGFIGRNLVAHLKPRGDVRLLAYDLGNTEAELRRWVCEADVVFHLAGVNRPRERRRNSNPATPARPRHSAASSASPAAGHSVILSSSIQAALRQSLWRQQAARRGDSPAISRRKAGRRSASSGSRTCLGNGAGRTTTRSSPRSATISPTNCRSRFPTPTGNRTRPRRRRDCGVAGRDGSAARPQSRD